MVGFNLHLNQNEALVDLTHHLCGSKNKGKMTPDI